MSTKCHFSSSEIPHKTGNIFFLLAEVGVVERRMHVSSKFALKKHYKAFWLFDLCDLLIKKVDKRNIPTIVEFLFV